jgi:ankyrin repeat protein
LYLAAASNESPEVTRVLLKYKAMPNVRDKSGRTPLWVAANRVSARVVQLLLDAGSSVDDPNDDGVTPLLAASEKPKGEVLSFLVKAGANPNIRGKNRYTPLMSAVAAGADVDAVKALLGGNADVKAENDQNRSAMHLLTSRRDATPEVLSALVAAGASPNALDSSLTTPLMEASKQKNAAVVSALLKAGARTDMRDRNSWSAFLHAVSKGAPLEIYELLKGAGADVNDTTRQGMPALMVAIESKIGIEGLEALLKAGTNPNGKGYDTVSVLMGAIATEDVATVETLLKYGANPNQTTWDGLSPLMLAAQRIDNPALFQALTTHSADVNAQSDQGVTALMVAVTSDNTVALESLIASADLEIKDLDGFTLLHHVAQREENEESQDVLDILIKAGGDVNAHDASGATPLMHAVLGGKYGMVSRLIDAGAKLDATDHVGWTPLHFAARSGEGEEVAGLLIERFSLEGKSVDAPDSGGTTPLMVAASYDNGETTRLLLEAGANFSQQDNTGRSAYEYASMKNSADSLSALKEAMEQSQQLQKVNTDPQAQNF